MDNYVERVSQFPQDIPLTTKEVAEIMNFTPEYISQLCRKGYVKAMRKGKRWFIMPVDLLDFIHMYEQGGWYGKKILQQTGGEEVEVTHDLWDKSEVRREGTTERDMRGWGRTGRGYSIITTKLADELRGLEPGESVRLYCRDIELARKIQSYIRDAAQMAGWYNTIPNKDDWTKWQWWLSHTEPCDGGEGCFLQVVRLREAKPAKRPFKKRKTTTQVDTESWEFSSKRKERA